MESTEPNAGASAVINSRKENDATARSSAQAQCACRLQEFQVVGVPWDISFLEPSEDRVKGHCKKETTRRTTLSYSSGHEELSPFCSRKFHVCDAVLV